MIYQVVALHDVKARAFLIPVFVPHIDLALRSIAHGCNSNPGHPLHDYPQDFTIYHLGTFDDTSATFTTFAQPLSLGLVSNLKDVQAPRPNLTVAKAVTAALDNEGRN